MVTSRRPPTQEPTARKASASRSRRADPRPQASASGTATPYEARAALRDVETKLKQIGRAGAKFTRHWMKEVASAAQACRDPMKAIWHHIARASRGVARDAVVAWNEMTLPAAAAKPAPAGKSRRPAA
jgi:phage tail tape-measure protein